MDDKAITAVSTSLALMQIQVNALVLLLEQQSGVSVKEDFQRLISEGVQAVGVETMQGIRSRIYEGITQQAAVWLGSGPGTGMSGGSSSAHFSTAQGQRVRKWQPEGRCSGWGTVPGIVGSGCLGGWSRRGTARSRPCVYG